MLGILGFNNGPMRSYRVFLRKGNSEKDEGWVEIWKSACPEVTDESIPSTAVQDRESPAGDVEWSPLIGLSQSDPP